MNRITTSLATLAVSAVVLQSANAAGETLDTIGARMSAIEARLSKIESTVNPGSDQREQAMIDATRNSAPVQNTAPAPAAAGATKTYVIKTGDTVGEIARKNGVPREALLQANRLSEGQPIYIGETLVIPTAPSASSNTTLALSTPEKPKTAPTPPAPKVEAPAPKAPATGSSSYHTVAKGETLTAISRKYGTTVAALKSANSLNNDIIDSGQKLRIPSAGSSNTPPATQASATTTPAGNGTYSYDNPLLNKNVEYGYYTVRKGDNLYALARDFFSTMSELQRINRLGTSTLIHPGDELIVPTSKYNAYHNKQSNVAAR